MLKGGLKGGEAAIPVLREPWILYCNTCGQSAQATLSFSTQVCSSLEPRSGAVEMNSMYMSTCVKALCRHVYKNNNKQTHFFFVSEHAATFYTRSAQLVICCETYESEDKNKTTGSCCLAEIRLTDN